MRFQAKTREKARKVLTFYFGTATAQLTGYTGTRRNQRAVDAAATLLCCNMRPMSFLRCRELVAMWHEGTL
jgi:hypothetical protein